MKEIFPDGEVMYFIIKNRKVIKTRFSDEKKWTLSN
jgi:hypothetical protein